MTAAMLQKIKSIEFENKSIKYAKPATKYVRGYGKGELRLNKSTMDLLLAMSKYVDSSSRVVININKLDKIQKRTLEESLKQAEFERLWYKKDGAYYSNFHIITTGEGANMEYIRILDEFTSPVYLNYTLNQQRLLCYFLTSSTMGSPQVYNMVKLYKNKAKMKILLATKNKGLDIFPTFKEFLIALAVLITNDQIVVKLKKRCTS